MAKSRHTKKAKPNWTRVVACAIAGLLALSLLLSALIGALSASALVTQADLDKIKNQISETAAKKNQLKGELSELSSDKTSVSRQMSTLDELIAQTEKEIDEQEQYLEQIALMLDNKTVELEDSTLRQEEQYATMRERIRFTAERGTLSYLEILLSADGFADFLTQYELVNQVSKYDKLLFDQLRAIREEVARQKQEIEELQAEQIEQKSLMDENKVDLERQLSDKSAQMQNILQLEADTLDAYKQMAEEEDELVEKQRQLAAEYASQQIYVGGMFQWPLPAANNVITCIFGPRTHPITGKPSNHTGIDIRATTGTKIYAANGGTVVTSTYSSVWGNYVIINHGGGYTTLYAHMKSRAVSVNDKVGKGDVIGYVGSTGYSTGPHLHFEISKDGTPINPLKHESFTSFNVKYS